MFNCGMLAIELEKASLDLLFAMQGNIEFKVDLQQNTMTVVCILLARPRSPAPFS